MRSPLLRSAFIALFILLSGATLRAQDKKAKPEPEAASKILNFQFHYTYQFPGGDLVKRFGNLNNVGFGGLMKSRKNWLYSLDASYQWGTEVKESDAILHNLTNSSYTISNRSGFPGAVTLGERGLNIFAKGGKLFSLSGQSPNSGIVVMGGVGFLSHKVNINTPKNDIPGLTDELKKGYDRLSMGFAVTEFIGYHFQGKRRLVNFYFGVDAIQAFTKSTRGYNYDQMAYDNKSRFDVMLGPRFGWMIPVYLTTSDQNEFYYK